jgi:hypothetical protein
MLETVGVQNFEAAYSVAESELAQVKDALTGTEKEIARISREYYAEQDRPEAERDREKIGRLQSQYEAIAPRAEQLAKTVKNHEMQLKTGAQIRANVTAIKPLRAALPDYVQAVATGRINPYAPLGEQITVLNTLRMAQGKPAVCVPGLTPKPAAIGKQPAPAPGNKSLAAQMKKKLGIVAGTSGGGGGAAGGKGGGGAPARPKVASKDPRALSAVGRNWKF